MNLPKAPDPETPEHGTNEQGRLSDSQESDTFEVVFADPWLKKTEWTADLPNDLRFVCTYEENLVVDLFDFSLFLRRTETTDELWIDDGYNIGRVFAITRKGEELTACLKLIELLVRARHGFEWPEAFLVAGTVDESSFTSVVRKIEKELDENKQKARETETAIIKVARKLGLSPKPTGEGPSHWFARCPGRIHGKPGNHVLFINAAENSFGCGWCCRKGGVE